MNPFPFFLENEKNEPFVLLGNAANYSFRLLYRKNINLERKKIKLLNYLVSFIKLHNAVSPLVWAFLHCHDVGGIQNLIGTEIS